MPAHPCRDDGAGGVAMGQRQVEPGQHLRRGAAGPHTAGLQQHQVVRQPSHLVDGVTDIHHWNGQLNLQALQVGQYFGFAGGVQCGQWFVHQQQPRAAGQGAANGYALALTAREFMGPALQQVFNAQQGHGMVPAVAALIGWRALEAIGQVVLHVEVVKQAGFLKYIAQRALVHGSKNALRTVLPQFAGHANPAFGLLLQSGQNPQAGGFARARGAKQRGNATGGQLQGHIQRELAARQNDLQHEFRVRFGVLICSLIHCAVSLRRLLLYRCKARSTTNEKPSITAASRCASPYSMASTWS